MGDQQNKGVASGDRADVREFGSAGFYQICADR